LQPARRSVRPAEVAPALLALLQEVISHDEPPVMVPRQPSLPTRRTYLRSCRAPPQAKDALRCSHHHVLLTASRASQSPIGHLPGHRLRPQVRDQHPARPPAEAALAAQVSASPLWQGLPGRPGRALGGRRLHLRRAFTSLPARPAAAAREAPPALAGAGDPN